MKKLRLPLAVDPNSFLSIIDVDGHGIASTNIPMAHLIVHAVNSHARLLAALRGVLGFHTLLLSRDDLPADLPYMLTSNHRVKDAIAAISAAEELA